MIRINPFVEGTLPCHFKDVRDTVNFNVRFAPRNP